MDWSSIGTAASDAATATADAAGGLFDTLGDYTTTAFDWINDNPEAANVIGGVMSGIGSYYAQKDQQAWKEKMYRRQRADQMANPGTIENYGSYVGTAKKGLLTNGQIAGGE